MNPIKPGVCSVLLLAAVACGPITEPPPTLLWQAELVPTDVNDPIGGSAAMVSTSSATQIGIGVTNAPPQSVLGWNVRSGRCDGAGQPLAPATSFPALSVNADGEGETQMLLNRRLGDGEYAAQLFADNSGDGLLIACADLVRISIQ